MENAIQSRADVPGTANPVSRIWAGTVGRVDRRELGMLAAAVGLCVVLAMSNPSFRTFTNFTNTTRQMGMLGVLAIGSAFVIITGGIDLSVGSIVGLTGVILAKVSSSTTLLNPGLGYSFAIGIPVALGAALLIGLVQGLLITRLDLQPFIVTLGGMLTIRGIAQTIAKGGAMGFGDSDFPNLSSGNLVNVDNFTFGSHLPHWGRAAVNVLIDGQTIPYALWVFLAVIAISAYLLHFTVFGRYIYAIGGNRDACEYSGIPVKKVETITYVISGGLAGVAGILYAAYNGEQSQNAGLSYELWAIAACVLGGCSLRGGEGTVFGVVVGTALMRIIENGLNMFQVGGWHPNENWRFIVIGGVILIAVIIDQLVHLAQERRRTYAAATAAGPGPYSSGGTQGVLLEEAAR